MTAKTDRDITRAIEAADPLSYVLETVREIEPQVRINIAWRTAAIEKRTAELQVDSDAYNQSVATWLLDHVPEEERDARIILNMYKKYGVGAALSLVSAEVRNKLDKATDILPQLAHAEEREYLAQDIRLRDSLEMLCILPHVLEKPLRMVGLSWTSSSEIFNEKLDQIENLLRHTPELLRHVNSSEMNPVKRQQLENQAQWLEDLLESQQELIAPAMSKLLQDICGAVEYALGSYADKKSR